MAAGASKRNSPSVSVAISETRWPRASMRSRRASMPASFWPTVSTSAWARPDRDSSSSRWLARRAFQPPIVSSSSKPALEMAPREERAGEQAGRHGAEHAGHDSAHAGRRTVRVRPRPRSRIKMSTLFPTTCERECVRLPSDVHAYHRANPAGSPTPSPGGRQARCGTRCPAVTDRPAPGRAGGGRRRALRRCPARRHAPRRARAERLVGNAPPLPGPGTPPAATPAHGLRRGRGDPGPNRRYSA